MHPVLIHQKYSSEERVNDDERDLLLELDVYEDVFASSRGSTNECRVSSNMDHDDSWEVTIVPSLLSQATSSNDTSGPSVRILNTVTEHEGKRDLYSLFGGHKRDNEQTCTNEERLKIAPSPTYERLNDENSRRPSDKRSTSASRGDALNRTDEKPSNTRSRVREDTNNESRAPFIELGAVYKVLDFITDSDPKVSLTNNCCNDISRTLRHLIALRRDKKLDDLLLNDPSLYRCERCGVISHTLESYRGIERIETNGTTVMNNAGIMTAERDCINDSRNKEEARISRSKFKNNEQSRTYVNKIDYRAKYKDGLNEAESLPVRERSFVMRRRIKSPNGANNISNTEADAKSKNTPLNNSAIKRLFTNCGAAKRDTGYNLDIAVRKNDRSCHDRLPTATEVCANADTEKVVKKILYGDKSRIENPPVADWLFRSKPKSLRRLFEKDDVSVADTVKYLARGQFTISDKREEDLLSKLRDRHCVSLEDPRKRPSSVLYGSHDDNPRCSGFWLFDKSGHLPEVASNEYCHLLELDNISDGFRAYDIGKNPKKTSGWPECMEKDSLENCALLEQKEGSDTVTFSSSSAENLMCEWMGTLNGRDNTSDAGSDVPRGRRLVSSRPSLDIARHVRAEIAEAKRRSDNARESMGETRACDSNVLIQLSPKTRNKICRSIEEMIPSDAVTDSTSCREKNLANNVDALNSEKLPRSEFSNVTFVYSDKSFKRTNNKITNSCLDDCIPIKLSELSEDKSRLIDRRDNVGTCNESTNEPNRVRISHEYPGRLGETKLANYPCLGRIARRIIYKNMSPRNVNDDVAAEISPIYREILENSEDLDWDGFRELVEHLHPGQKALWRDVCKTVHEEAAKVTGDADGSTEVCIEISPVIFDEDLKPNQPMTYAREIAFELDMTLKNVEGFLDKRPHLAEERLDTHKDEDVMDRSDGERKLIPKRTR